MVSNFYTMYNEHFGVKVGFGHYLLSVICTLALVLPGQDLGNLLERDNDCAGCVPPSAVHLCGTRLCVDLSSQRCYVREVFRRSIYHADPFLH